MNLMEPRPVVRELRIALTVEDFDKAAAFYRDALGLPVVKEWDGPGGRGIILQADLGTLEVSDQHGADSSDTAEVGKPTGLRIRIGAQVNDIDAMFRRLVTAGASSLGEPAMMPWGNRSSRLETPDGIQLSLFELDVRRPD
jgi:catechol 2,3-dioxygenase-like lactoylglutathione lyase family enzyme